jgi:hypothetical protein
MNTRPLLSLAAVGLALSTYACAPALPATAASPELRFAVTAPPASVASTRVLAKRVNLREPVSVAVDGGAVLVRYASRGRTGAELRVDPRTLDVTHETPFTFDGEGPAKTPAYLRVAQAAPRVAGGGRLVVTTDDDAGQVLAHVVAADGAARGEPVAVSGERNVVGMPRAATADGRRVVVVYLASTEDGCELVAASVAIEVAP